MTDAQDKPQDAPKPAEATPGGALWAMGLLGAIPGLLAALAGAGWPGVLAIALGGVALLAGGTFLVKKLNLMVDGRDLSRAGADAGKTAVDLANQAADNRTEMDKLRDEKPPVQ